MKYRVYIIQAHMGEAADSSLTDNTTLELEATLDEPYATILERAKQLVPDKKFYRLARIVENFYDKS
jgi:hypothetical protein